MHVIQPYPATWKPSVSNGANRPAFSRYAVTAREPGAKLVLTNEGVRSPRSTAFFAKRPAAIIRLGLLVFVQLVMEAITTGNRDAETVNGETIPSSVQWFLSIFSLCCILTMYIIPQKQSRNLNARKAFTL